MPWTHCFSKHRDLRPHSFYAGVKDLGQNQSFKDFLLKKFKDSLASSQAWSDLFEFLLGTHKQARNWPALMMRATQSPRGLFSPGSYKVGEESQELSADKGRVTAWPNCSALLGAGVSPTHQPGLDESTRSPQPGKGETGSEIPLLLPIFIIFSLLRHNTQLLQLEGGEICFGSCLQSMVSQLPGRAAWHSRQEAKSQERSQKGR